MDTFCPDRGCANSRCAACRATRSNMSLRRLFGMVLSVADDWMAERRKLHPDLVLQPRHQRDSDKRSAAQQALDRIAKFSTGCFRVALRGQFLEHSFLPKMVNERASLSLRCPRTTARYCLTGVCSRNCRTSACRSGQLLANSKIPDVYRSMRCTTKARCLFCFSSAEKSDRADGAPEFSPVLPEAWLVC